MYTAAIEQLTASAQVCETNAPIFEAEGNSAQAALSRSNALSLRAAIAKLSVKENDHPAAEYRLMIGELVGRILDQHRGDESALSEAMDGLISQIAQAAGFIIGGMSEHPDATIEWFGKTLVAAAAHAIAPDVPSEPAHMAH
jgi:hypothetical protein